MNEVKPPKALLPVICLAQLMVMVDIAIVNVALPSIKDALDFSSTSLQWVPNAYTLTFAGFLMLGGRACDLLGRRQVFLAGIALFGLSSLACALAASPGLLVGARAVQGLGAAIISPATLAILATAFPSGHERNRAFGAWASMSGLGGSGGMLLGGILIQAFGWPAIFVVNLPVAVLVVVLARRVAPASPAREEHREFDLAGALLVTAGLTAIVLGTIRSDALGWGSLGVLGPLAAGLALLAAFALVESRAADPLVPPRVLRMPVLRAANLVIVLLFMGTFSVWVFLSLYMHAVLGFDPLQSGLAFLPLTLAVFGSAQLAPRAVRRFGVRATLAPAMVCTAAGFAILTLIDPGTSYVAGMLPGGLLVSAGLGFAYLAATVAAIHGVPSRESGLASGILNSSRLVGGALGLAAFSTLAAARTKSSLAAGAGELAALTDGWRAAFVLSAVAALLGAVAALALLRSPRAPAADAAAELAAPVAPTSTFD